ncbi:hypothetical protein PVL29_018441 [Vitis rotundifolia]|uniref:AAA+ ATPase domain-containing protein n=1 Tax=Vitis rotundifolia TaxID=103349 RepID=A0AA39DHM9_VITRO|nr:hypothetical protein PVL29_018441 [Vitis rotundifolia]
MAEIAVSIVSGVANYLVDPIRRQLGYLIHYNSNTAELREQVEKLGGARRSLQLRVDEANRQGDEILPAVLNWLTSAGSIMQKAEEFIEDEKKANKSCFNGLCPNLISRYQLSRQAKRKGEDVKKSLGEGNFQTISYRPPLAGARYAPGKDYADLASRKQVLKDIMEALRNDDTNMIGVWGMGGVGKTTLVKQVAKLAEDEKLFDQVAVAFVSQTVDLKKIQAQIADVLSFKFVEESESGRAGRLSQRLKKEKKLLIILDDIWAKLDLEAVGIPYGDDHKGCKMVLTSRKHGVLSKEMGTQKNFPVDHLPEDEAWSLFKEKAGESIDKPDLQPTAKEVARKCGGLPIAIVTVAKALKGEDLTTWNDALRRLTRSIETTIEGIEATIFLNLELSYNHLYGDEVKSLFLLCGLLDYGDTPIDKLFKYGVGRDLFENINALEEARDRLHTLINNLKASSLLLDSDDDAYVRMHDVVREVARAIASKDPHSFVVKEDDRFEKWSKTDESKRCASISLNCKVVHELPERLVCPELQFFLLHSNNRSLKIPNTFFEEMKQLKVLDLSKMHFTTLPSSLHSLANLRTLCIDECELGDMGLIGELKKLEVLSLVGSNIKQLPIEIAKLSCLRLLDLTYCRQLEVIPRNVLSSLSQLENLCMEHSSFTHWGDEDISNQESNACLSELKHLSHLTILDVKTRDLKLLPKDLAFENLIRYRIYIGEVWDWYQECKAKRVLRLNKVHKSLHLEDRIGKLLKRTEELYLWELSGTKSVLYDLDGDGFLHLKHLHINRSPEIQYIIDSKGQWVPQHGVFPLLESLILYNLINLEEVCHGPIPIGSFGKLRTLGVTRCHGLKLLLLLSTARGLLQLEKLKIEECSVIQQIITYERESEIIEDDHIGTSMQLFPKLRSLKLRDLPQLINFNFDLDPTSSTSWGRNARSKEMSYQGNLDTSLPFFSHQVCCLTFILPFFFSFTPHFLFVNGLKKKK